jgi:site-specific DNA recombinase
MRAALYTRVSTQEQAVEGFSLDAQLHRLTAYCESQGWTITDVYTDEGISAKDMERPELQRMLADAAAKKFEVILVYKLDRLTRSVSDLYEMLQIFERYGIGFKSATEVFDTTTAMGRLFITIVAALAQWERETIGERSREGQAQMVREGRFFGHTAPYGYDLVDGKLVVNEPEAEVVRTIFRLYLAGNGASRIAKYLNDPANKMLPPHNSDKWSLKVVLDMLKNHAYAGYVRYGNKTRNKLRRELVIAKGDHTPLISEDTFEQVQRLMSERLIVGARSGTGNHPLVGVLRCGLCGGPMIARTEPVGKNGRRTPYYGYMCNTRRHKRTCTMKMWQKEPLETRVIDEVERLRTERAPQIDVNTEQDNAQERALKEQLIRLQNERKRWLDAYRKEAISADELREQRQIIERQEAAIQEQLSALAKDESPSLFEHITKDFRVMWEAATPQEQRELIRSIVDTIWVYEDGSVKIDLRGGF